METILLVWINKKRMAGDSVSEVICEKAKQLLEELGARAPSTSTAPAKEFLGTKRWFTGFRKRNGLHSVVSHGEATSADRDAAEQHPEKFKKMNDKEDFCFTAGVLTVMKLAFSGRQCHTEHISQRRRPPCLAVS